MDTMVNVEDGFDDEEDRQHGRRYVILGEKSFEGELIFVFAPFCLLGLRDFSKVAVTKTAAKGREIISWYVFFEMDEFRGWSVRIWRLMEFLV